MSLPRPAPSRTASSVLAESLPTFSLPTPTIPGLGNASASVSVSVSSRSRSRTPPPPPLQLPGGDTDATLSQTSAAASSSSDASAASTGSAPLPSRGSRFSTPRTGANPKNHRWSTGGVLSRSSSSERGILDPEGKFIGASSDFLPVSSPPRPFAAKRFSSLNSDDEPLFRPFDPHDIHASSPISSSASMNPFPSRAFLELSNPTTGSLFDHHMHANPNGADAHRHSTSSSSHRDHPHFDVLKSSSSSSSSTTHRSQHGFSLDEPALHPMPSDLDRDFASRKHLGKMFDAELPRAHGRFFASKSRSSSMEPERLRGLRGVNALAESDEESMDTELALRRRRKFNASPGRPNGSSRRRQRRRQSKEDDVTITRTDPFVLSSGNDEATNPPTASRSSSSDNFPTLSDIVQSLPDPNVPSAPYHSDDEEDKAQFHAAADHDMGMEDSHSSSPDWRPLTRSGRTSSGSELRSLPIFKSFVLMYHPKDVKYLKQKRGVKRRLEEFLRDTFGEEGKIENHDDRAKHRLSSTMFDTPAHSSLPSPTPLPLPLSSATSASISSSSAHTVPPPPNADLSMLPPPITASSFGPSGHTALGLTSSSVGMLHPQELPPLPPLDTPLTHMLPQPLQMKREQSDVLMSDASLHVPMPLISPLPVSIPGMPGPPGSIPPPPVSTSSSMLPPPAPLFHFPLATASAVTAAASSVATSLAPFPAAPAAATRSHRSSLSSTAPPPLVPKIEPKVEVDEEAPLDDGDTLVPPPVEREATQCLGHFVFWCTNRRPEKDEVQPKGRCAACLAGKVVHLSRVRLTRLSRFSDQGTVNVILRKASDRNDIKVTRFKRFYRQWFLMVFFSPQEAREATEYYNAKEEFLYRIHEVIPKRFWTKGVPFVHKRRRNELSPENLDGRNVPDLTQNEPDLEAAHAAPPTPLPPAASSSASSVAAVGVPPPPPPPLPKVATDGSVAATLSSSSDSSASSTSAPSSSSSSSSASSSSSSVSTSESSSSSSRSRHRKSTTEDDYFLQQFSALSTSDTSSHETPLKQRASKRQRLSSTGNAQTSPHLKGRERSTKEEIDAATPSEQSGGSGAGTSGSSSRTSDVVVKIEPGLTKTPDTGTASKSSVKSSSKCSSPSKLSSPSSASDAAETESASPPQRSSRKAKKANAAKSKKREEQEEAEVRTKKAGMPTSKRPEQEEAEAKRTKAGTPTSKRPQREEVKAKGTKACMPEKEEAETRAISPSPPSCRKVLHMQGWCECVVTSRKCVHAFDPHRWRVPSPRPEHGPPRSVSVCGINTDESSTLAVKFCTAPPVFAKTARNIMTSFLDFRIPSPPPLPKGHQHPRELTVDVRLVRVPSSKSSPPVGAAVGSEQAPEYDVDPCESEVLAHVAPFTYVFSSTSST